ncbi:hypothetical protein GGX14DRAFT_544110 [Mycena pura]|uniref:Uncharacterized protein n=1 Tax=Mycena pura TaxID=153505 RepID=A0AAD6Y7W9_9AGAR|nr:hypothetical protein GGX14DRAFT_544110 [Mycena pura]
MSSLSSVVSDLVRASMGTSVAPQVTDEELDRHVADLILKEAKKKAERFGQDGIRAYLRSGMSDSNAPRTNKRFISSIIRSTDDHNKTILQAQAQAAQELKRQRDEVERRERRARAEEAVAAEILRRSRARGSSSRWKGNEAESWDHWDGRTAERPARKPRNWETWTGEDADNDVERDRHRRSRRHRSRSGDRRRRNDDRSSRRIRREHSSDSRIDDSARRRHDEKRPSRSHAKSRRRSPSRLYSDDEKYVTDSRSRPARDRRHALSSLSPSRSSNGTDDSRPLKRQRSASLSRSNSRRRYESPMAESSDVVAREVELRQKLKSTRTKDDTRPVDPPSKRDRSPSAERTKSSEPPPKRTKAGPSSRMRSPSPSRSPSLTPGPEPELQLPSKMDKYFEESYDPRLDIAPMTVPKVPATGLINNAEYEGWDAMLELIRLRQEDREEKKMMERLGLTKPKTKSHNLVSSSAANDRWNGVGLSIMEIEYKKRGTVREWDLGKEGL